MPYASPKILSTSLTRRSALTLLPVMFVVGSKQAFAENLSQHGIELINRERLKSGLSPLSYSQKLTQAAQNFSKVLAQSTTFSHYADGSDLIGRAGSVNYRYQTLAENIGWIGSQDQGAAQIEALTNRWMASDGHRKNILNPKVTEVGIGLTRAGSKLFGVQIFARPLE